MDETKKKILIIEDDNTLRNMLSDSLGRDYEIVQAEDGEKGLAYVLDFRPDLILLDLLLPKLDGFGLLQRLRQYPDRDIAGTKVIIFSNFSSQEYIAKAKEFKVVSYLPKTSTPMEDLIKKIEEALILPVK